ncbi:MAG: hypothetical protein WC359_14925 [Dehalococcoidia bacterium]
MKRCRCGNEIRNAEGVAWVGELNMICRTCCGDTQDGKPDFINGRPHVGIGMPQGSYSYGLRATRITTHAAR